MPVVWDWLGKLVLVIATALAAFLLGPFLTDRWQDHKDAVARRSVLVEQISDASGTFVGAAHLEAHRTASASSAFDAAFVKWQVESEALHSRISAYETVGAANKW